MALSSCTTSPTRNPPERRHAATKESYAASTETSQESFKSVYQWLQQAEHYIGDNVSVFIVGNKSDLQNWRAVDYSTAAAVAKQLGVTFLETSVLDGSKVDEIFRTMASEIKGRVVSSTTGAEVDRSDVKTAETGSIEFSSCFFKVILIGSSRVGKSRLARLLLGKDSNVSDVPNEELSIKRMELAGETVFLYFYVSEDVLGCTSASHLRDAQGVIALYDVTDAVSFEYAEQWLQDMDRSGCKDVVKVLVGYKNELEARKVVDNATARELADQLGIASFEVSDKSGAGAYLSPVVTTMQSKLSLTRVVRRWNATTFLLCCLSAIAEKTISSSGLWSQGKRRQAKPSQGGAYTRIRDHQPNLEFTGRFAELLARSIQTKAFLGS
ncbi:hypothetical protein V5799_032268 [Amblyomma americanum]|uniref:Uncharacterized protein n=1 Tax=Amblyomma americanum TaxID=6943 RepID=A0AAQ4DRN3_AMBAM